MDIVYTIIIYTALAFVAFILWCAVMIASNYDKITDEQWNSFLEKEGQTDEGKSFFETD